MSRNFLSKMDEILVDTFEHSGVTWINGRVMIPNRMIGHSKFSIEIYNRFRRRTMKKGKLLCLVGVHGGANPDSQKTKSLMSWTKMIPNFKNFGDRSKTLISFLSDIGLELEMVDIGKLRDYQELDEKIKNHFAADNPNEIFLAMAFDHKNVSALNSILRSAEMYSHLMICNHRTMPIQEKCCVLDNNQRQVIADVANYHDNWGAQNDEQKIKPRNIVLCGISGTGKTSILTELLLMRISHYKKQGIPLQIFIVCFPDINLRLKEREEYFKHAFLSNERGQDIKNTKVEFLTLQDIFLKYGLHLEDESKESKSFVVDNLNKLLTSMESDKKTMLFMDEMYVAISQQGDRTPLQDLENITPVSNVDFFLGLSIVINCVNNRNMRNITVKSPSNSEILTKQLTYIHGSCRKNLQLLKHVKLDKSTSIDLEHDIVLWDSLPEGEIPLWIVCEEMESQSTILKFIHEHHISEGHSVCIITDTDTHLMKMWCAENAKKRSARVSNKLDISGIWDDVIIFWNLIPSMEAMTKARKRIILVTIKR